MSKKVQAVVDRISEETKAVILAEEINKEYVVDIHTVECTLREGLWLDLYLTKEEQIKKIVPNEKLTSKKQSSVKERLNRLRKRKGSNYKIE